MSKYKNTSFLCFMCLLTCATIYNSNGAYATLSTPNGHGGNSERHHVSVQVKLQSYDDGSQSKNGDNNSIKSNLSLVNVSNNSLPSPIAQSSNYTKELKKAIGLYNMALKIEPNNPDILTNKGIVISLLGDREQALELYNTALTINPNHVGALFNKAKILNMTGNTTGAIYYMKEARKIDPSYGGELINLKSLALALAESKPEPQMVAPCNDSNPVNRQKLC